MRCPHQLSDGQTYNKHVDKYVLINRQYTDVMNIVTLVLDQSGRDTTQDKKIEYRSWV